MSNIDWTPYISTEDNIIPIEGEHDSQYAIFFITYHHIFGYRLRGGCVQWIDPRIWSRKGTSFNRGNGLIPPKPPVKEFSYYLVWSKETETPWPYQLLDDAKVRADKLKNNDLFLSLTCSTFRSDGTCETELLEVE